MKKLSGSILVITLFFASFASIHAQTTVMRPAVAFVTASRDTLFIKQPDSAVQAYDLASLITTLTGGEVSIDSIRQMAVIGMTPAGDRLVIAANYYYVNPFSSGHVLYQGLLTIPWPLSTFSLSNTVQTLLSSRGTNDFRPVGVLSADGKQWWVTFTSTSLGDDSLAFYHGNTDGTGTVDSTIAVGLEENFQMSNIAVDKTNNVMIAMSFDRLADTDPKLDGRTLMYAWQAGKGDLQYIDFSANYQTLAQIFTTNIDSMFGMTVIPNNDGSTAQIGLTSNSDKDNSINLFQIPYFNGSSFNLSDQVGSIPRSVIPTDQNFFAGPNCGLYQEDVLGRGQSQLANAGDVSVNAIGGDSVLFITHDAGDDCNNSNTAVYYYDLNAGGNAVLVYNDSGAQELQPVWVVTPYTVPAVPHYGGIAWQPVSSDFFGSIDTGNTSALSFTFSDTSAETAVVIDSANITGANASEFAITSGSAATTLQPTKTASITVTFTPVAPAETVNATLNVYFEGQPDGQSTITQSLSGTVVTPASGVQQDAVLASSLSIDPNPFSSSASVQLTSPDAGAMGIVVHDALGRTVYTSELRETGAGETQSFQFDAHALGLPDGVYYVTAFLGERQASRAVVFVR
jgi:hypothetical protein